MHQKALKLPHTVAIERSMKAIQEQRNCQMKSDWWAICHWLENKKANPTKKPYPEIHQQGAKLCLALNRYTVLSLCLKICLETWGRLGYIWTRCRVFWVSLPFHCHVGDKLRGQRVGTSLWFYAVERWVWRGKGLCFVMAGRGQHTPLYTEALQESPRFLKQRNLLVLRLRWSCLLVSGCFRDSLRSEETCCFIKCTK